MPFWRISALNPDGFETFYRFINLEKLIQFSHALEVSNVLIPYVRSVMSERFMRPLHKAALPLLLWYCFCSGSIKAADRSHQLNSQNPVVAQIGTQPVRLQSLEDKKINTLRKQLYQAISLKLRVKALQQLGKSHSRYVTKTEPEVTDQEIADFYATNRLTSKGTLRELAPEIRHYITRSKMQQLQITIDKLYQKAIDEGLVTQYIKEPNDFLTIVPVETGYIRNKATSHVMLLEFSDYQCPACKAVQPTIRQLRSKYDKKVLFAYRHFPLSFHKEADEAAISVECSREQGKFESFHQYFFSNQRELSREKNRILDYLKSLGKKLNIRNRRKFNRCLETEKYRDLISSDIETGLAIGITGTPAFIIGRYNPERKLLKGELVVGALSLASFEKSLRKYM